MNDHHKKSLEAVTNALKKMSREEFYERMFGERDRARARAKLFIEPICKFIVDHNICLDNENIHYNPHVYEELYKVVPREEVENFLNHIDLDDKDLIEWESTDENNPFPNSYYHTKYGVTISMMMGQGTSIQLYKTVDKPLYNDDNKHILSEN